MMKEGTCGRISFMTTRSRPISGMCKALYLVQMGDEVATASKQPRPNTWCVVFAGNSVFADVLLLPLDVSLSSYIYMHITYLYSLSPLPRCLSLSTTNDAYIPAMKVVPGSSERFGDARALLSFIKHTQPSFELHRRY